MLTFERPHKNVGGSFDARNFISNQNMILAQLGECVSLSAIFSVVLTRYILLFHKPDVYFNFFCPLA